MWKGLISFVSKTAAVLLWLHPEKAESFVKDSNGGGTKAGGKEEENRRWIGSVEEALGMSLQGLSRAVEDRTLWILLICRVSGIRDDSMACKAHSKDLLWLNFIWFEINYWWIYSEL